MSFSSSVKSELSKLPLGNKCCNRAEIYGILMYCGEFSSSRIKISVENMSAARRIQILFFKVFGFELDGYERITKQRSKVVFEVTDQLKIKRVFEEFGYEYGRMTLHINFAIIEEKCCKTAFIRGAFITGGLVSNPDRRYHLEIASHHYNLINELVSLMFEVGFKPKNGKKRNDYTVYLKDSGSIEEFLTCIGASMCAVSIMQIKVEKELRNETNRRINCDEANIAKTITAAAKQIEAINRLKGSGKYDSLPEELKITAEIRLRNPELTLRELLALFNPPISKPGLSHRLNRIIEISRKEG